jgi:acyl-CoA synthetase (AMP-forming)/AMP-acid ligase II
VVPEGITLVHALPAVLADVLDRPVAPRLRRALVAGASGTAQLRPAASARGIEVVEYYGAAELSFVGLDDDGTGFTPFPQVGVELRGEQVWVRSAFTSLGYLPVPGLDPAAPLQYDDDGWASVGDRARLTADQQRFVLLGRPEAALVGGVTVVLADVEAVLAEVPGVSDVACLAAPDAVLGQQVVAVLALDPAVELLGRHDLRRRVRGAVRAQLPQARALRLHLVPTLPRTAAGKIDRVALSELASPTAGTDLP